MLRARMIPFSVLSVLTLGIVLARADLVPPPPTDCPPGTRGATNHAGPHCLPVHCSDQRPCPKGETCALAALCLVERTYANMTGQRTTTVVQGLCRNGQCEQGTCRREPVCVSRPWASAAPSSRAAPSAPDGDAAETAGSPGIETNPDTSGGQSTESVTQPIPGRPLPGCSSLHAAAAITGVVLAGLAASIALVLRRRGPGRRG
jgi:hypothetical protein